MKKQSTNSTSTDSVVTAGDVKTPCTELQDGVEFGLRLRKPGVLYLPKFPEKNLAAKMCKDGLYCVGVDVFEEVKWLRWEKKSITEPIKFAALETNYDSNGKYIGPPWVE